MNPELALWLLCGFWGFMLLARGFMQLLWWWGMRTGKLKFTFKDSEEDREGRD